MILGSSQVTSDVLFCSCPAGTLAKQAGAASAFGAPPSRLAPSPRASAARGPLDAVSQLLGETPDTIAATKSILDARVQQRQHRQVTTAAESSRQESLLSGSDKCKAAASSLSALLDQCSADLVFACDAKLGSSPLVIANICPPAIDMVSAIDKLGDSDTRSGLWQALESHWKEKHATLMHSSVLPILNAESHPEEPSLFKKRPCFYAKTCICRTPALKCSQMLVRFLMRALADKKSAQRRAYDRSALVFTLESPTDLQKHWFQVGYGNLNSQLFTFLRLRAAPLVVSG